MGWRPCSISTAVSASSRSEPPAPERRRSWWPSRTWASAATAGGPCCLVLDVRMPGMTGLDLQRTLAQAVHRIPIVFVTGQGDIPMTVTAMKAGAVDFLTKPFAARDLLDAVQRAVEKDTRNLGTEARSRSLHARVKTLTPRERQVFALVVTGMLNKQIAAQLGVVEKTVKVHRARVMDKMRAGSFAELVRLAADVGVIVTRA